MILPQLRDELARAASAKPVTLRARARALGALLAALGALLVAAPAVQGETAPGGATGVAAQAARQ